MDRSQHHQLPFCSSVKKNNAKITSFIQIEAIFDLRFSVYIAIFSTARLVTDDVHNYLRAEIDFIFYHEPPDFNKTFYPSLYIFLVVQSLKIAESSVFITAVYRLQNINSLSQLKMTLKNTCATFSGVTRGLSQGGQAWLRGSTD